MGQDGLSQHGNPDSVMQLCESYGVPWGGGGPGLSCLSFILKEMRELDSKKFQPSAWSNALPCSVRLPPRFYQVSLFHGNFWRLARWVL